MQNEKGSGLLIRTEPKGILTISGVGGGRGTRERHRRRARDRETQGPRKVPYCSMLLSLLNLPPKPSGCPVPHGLLCTQLPARSLQEKAAPDPGAHLLQLPAIPLGPSCRDSYIFEAHAIQLSSLALLS